MLIREEIEATARRLGPDPRPSTSPERLTMLALFAVVMLLVVIGAAGGAGA